MCVIKYSRPTVYSHLSVAALWSFICKMYTETIYLQNAEQHFDSENEKKAKAVQIITDWFVLLHTDYNCYQMLFTYTPPALLRPHMLSDFESQQEGVPCDKTLLCTHSGSNPNSNTCMFHYNQDCCITQLIADKELTRWYQETLWSWPSSCFFLLVLETGLSLLHKCCHALFTVILQGTTQAHTSWLDCQHQSRHPPPSLWDSTHRGKGSVE